MKFGSYHSNFIEIRFNWLVLVQCLCFSVLYAVWVLPGTIALRNICLGLGALLSVYPIYQARHFFFKREAIPIWLLIGLFIWAIFHLLLLSQNPVLQYEEFISIWKYAFIGAVFAFGFGITLSTAIDANSGDCRTAIKNRLNWKASKVISYLGLFFPTAIYLIKSCLAAYGSHLGITIPNALLLHASPNHYYIAKTAYVCFCIPILSISLSLLYENIINRRWFSPMNLVNILSIMSVFWVFNKENIKNGFVCGLFLIIIFCVRVAIMELKEHFLTKAILIFFTATACIFLLSVHIHKNESWRSFPADIKIAWQTDQYPQWKFSGRQGYPVNELGITVSVTNYERIAWAKEGGKLIIQNPLGYGLVERSFGKLSTRQWPGTSLTQSHSGWIDLCLGIGIPGLILIFVALFSVLADLSTHQSTCSWVGECMRWVLLALFFMWFTTEISQKVYFDNLIFWLSLGAGLTLRSKIHKPQFSTLAN